MASNSPDEVKAKRSALKRLIEAAKAKEGIGDTRDWALAHNLSISAVYDIMYGRVTKEGFEVKPRLVTLEKLSEALEVGIDELIFLFLPNARRSTTNRGSTPISLNVAGWVGAGPDQNMVEYRDILVDQKILGKKTNVTAFKIVGDSMHAGKNAISDGDVVLVDKDDKGYDGAPVVARINEDGYVCKILKDDKFGKYLVSKNATATNGTPPLIPGEQVNEIVGKVFYVFKYLA